MELETILQANKRQRFAVESKSAVVEDSQAIIYAPNIQQKVDNSLKWNERVFSSYLPCSSFSYEVAFPKDCVAPFDLKHQQFSFSVHDFNTTRKLAALVVKSVKIYISAVIKPGDIVLKVNDTNLTGTLEDPQTYEEMKMKLNSAKENTYVVRFLRVGGTSSNFLPSPSEISLFQSDKNTAAKFSVVRDGSKPVEDDPSSTATTATATKAKSNAALIQLIFLDSMMPPSIKKMMQGTKVSWEFSPVFVNNVTVSLSNTAQTNMSFVPLPSSQYSAPVLAQAVHGVPPYYTFTGHFVTPLSNVHAPAKGPSAPTPAAAAVVAAAAVDSNKSGSESKPEAPSPPLFAGVFRDRNKWCAVLEVPNRFVAVSDGYNLNSPQTNKQIFLGRFENVEEARYVYKKMEADFKSTGTFSTKRLIRCLRSTGFTSIASSLASAAASQAMAVTAGASTGSTTVGGGVGVGSTAGGVSGVNRVLLGPAGQYRPPVSSGSSGSSNTASYSNKPLVTGVTPAGGATSILKYPSAHSTGLQQQQQQQWAAAGSTSNVYGSAAPSYGKPGISLPPNKTGSLQPMQKVVGQAPPLQQQPQQHQMALNNSYGKQQSLPLSNQQSMPPAMQQQYSAQPLQPQQQQMAPMSYGYAPAAPPPNSYSNFGFAPVQSYYHPNDPSASSQMNNQMNMSSSNNISPAGYLNYNPQAPVNYSQAPIYSTQPTAAPPMQQQQYQPVQQYSNMYTSNNSSNINNNPSQQSMTYGSGMPNYAPQHVYATSGGAAGVVLPQQRSGSVPLNNNNNNNINNNNVNSGNKR